MLYESAARADEVLCLHAEDLYPQDKCGRITAKGGATEWIHWQSGTAQLLPRLIARRTSGQLFLTDRKAPAGTPTLDVYPETGRARTAALRRSSKRTPGCWPTHSPPPTTSRTWTAGPSTGSAAVPCPTTRRTASTPMLPARSRHASVRSLERYARPGVDPVARHVAERDPPARRRT
ncbi:site-specific integrase [Streptomyces sp. NBC_00391]|uniref:site-specific integrase n=1 Tax=Streptomyces sp. NBC_00391 TaxID=2903647 RepID=UPI002E1DF414